ncbi:MAG: hypothetical protein ACI376_08575 [Candidatus Bruticola sp.]
MPTNEINAQDLQMGASVYSKENDKVGTFRFALSAATPPYQVYQLVVDRADGVEGALVVSADSVEAVNSNTIRLTIGEEEFLGLNPFMESQWFSVHPTSSRDHRTLSKTRNPRRQDRRPRYPSRPQTRSGM